MPVLLATGYDFDRSREVRQGGAANLGERTTLTRNELNKAQNNDVFAQATWLASEQFSVVTGVRSSSIQFSSDDNYLADNRNGSGERRFRATSPVLGLTFHAARDLNLYANYGKGFETPTLSEVAYRVLGTAPIAEFNPTLNASVSHHRELGAKWTPRPNVRADLNLYQIDSRDEIVVSTSSGGQSAFQNAPGTSRKGAELNLRTQLNPHLRASVAANWIEAEFSQAFSYSVNNVANKVGNGFKIPGIPQHFVFSELLWTSVAADPMQPATGSARAASAHSGTGTRVALELIRAGQLFANDTNSESAPGYTSWNLMASQGWALGRANLAAYARVDNVLDEQYVGSVIVNQSAAKFYEPSPGRTWTLGLRYRLPLR
jgi:iron complex outermembrane receptor protein